MEPLITKDELVALAQKALKGLRKSFALNMIEQNTFRGQLSADHRRFLLFFRMSTYDDDRALRKVPQAHTPGMPRGHPW